MRFVLTSLLVLSIFACTPNGPPAAPVEKGPITVDTATSVVLTPITLPGLRYDGVYMMVDGTLHYYLRFFQRGNVALVGGPENETHFDSIPSIRTYLTENVQSGWNNVHNTPVQQRNDSLFFRTMTMKGAITYAGALRNDSLTVIKESAVTAKRAKLTYVFAADKP